MLSLDNLFNAATIKCMGASGDHGLIQYVETNRACLLTFDSELQHVLKSFDVFGCQWNHFMLVQKTSKSVYTILAKCPVVTDLAQAENDFQ